MKLFKMTNIVISNQLLKNKFIDHYHFTTKL